jgi:hypothetical protein
MLIYKKKWCWHELLREDFVTSLDDAIPNFVYGTQQKSPEAKSRLALTPSHFTLLPKIWYGILNPE